MLVKLENRILEPLKSTVIREDTSVYSRSRAVLLGQLGAGRCPLTWLLHIKESNIRRIYRSKIQMRWDLDLGVH